MDADVKGRVAEHGLRAEPWASAAPSPGVAGGCREVVLVVGSPPGFTLPLSGTAEARSTAGPLTAPLLPAFVARPRRANQPFGASQTSEDRDPLDTTRDPALSDE